MTWRSPLALKTTILCLSIGVIAGCARPSELTVLPAEATAHHTASPLAQFTVKPTVTQAAPKASATMQPREAFKLTILHTNDSRGYVDPCG